MHEALAHYPLTIELPVSWGEMDAFNHVNNTVYFRYFESARMAYFEKVGMIDYMQQHNNGPILGSTMCRFKAPLKYPDTVTVAARISGLQADCFTHHYCVVSHALDRVVAEGEGEVVYYDYNIGKRTDIPAVLRESIKRFDANIEP